MHWLIPLQFTLVNQWTQGHGPKRFYHRCDQEKSLGCDWQSSGQIALRVALQVQDLIPADNSQRHAGNVPAFQGLEDKTI